MDPKPREPLRGMKRSEAAQKGPPSNLMTFPSLELRKSARLYRSVGSVPDPSGTIAPRGFGWHSCDGSGRFDLQPPAGTLYLAFSPATALKERILAPHSDSETGEPVPPMVRGGRMARSEADRIFVWEVHPVTQPPIADLTGSGADTHFGVTNELSSGTTGYGLSRQWAQQFYWQEFRGIRYKSRFDTYGGKDAYALAAFDGTCGASDGWFKATQPAPEPATGHIRNLGITLVEPPSKPTNVVKLRPRSG